MNYSNSLSKLGLVSVLATENNIDYNNLDKRLRFIQLNLNSRILNKNKLSFFENSYRLADFYQKLTVKGSLYDKGKKLENKLINKVSEHF